MIFPQEKAAPVRRRKTPRINFNANAWRRLRDVYADQAISPVLDMQNRIPGIYLLGLDRLANLPSTVQTGPSDLIFVIGNWRSGTTFLHEMLCSDPGFNFPTTYACMNSQVFPITEAARLRRAGRQSIIRLHCKYVAEPILLQEMKTLDVWLIWIGSLFYDVGILLKLVNVALNRPNAY